MSVHLYLETADIQGKHEGGTHNFADSNVNIVPKIQYEPNSVPIKVSQILALDLNRYKNRTYGRPQEQLLENNDILDFEYLYDYSLWNYVIFFRLC